MTYQQIQEIEDIHKPFREAFLRFGVLDFALHSSIKSMAQLSGRVDHIEINIGNNPYSIDVVNTGELYRALNRSSFSCINWNNLFSNDPTVCDPEYDHLEEFLKYYFNMDKQFLENCIPKPSVRTIKPTEMQTFSLMMQDDNSISIKIEDVIGGNGSAKLIIEKGAEKQQYNLISEKVVGSDNVDNYFLYYNEYEKQKYKIANNYAYYNTDLFLQGMMSFRIRFINSRKELVSVTEEQDDDFRKLEFEITNEIERVTGTAAPYNIVKLFLRIFRVIFSPLPYENSEKSIVEELMPTKRDINLYSNTKATRMQDVYPPPRTEDMTDAAGLTSLRKELANLIRSAPAESIDTFGDIINICKKLFDDTSSLSGELRFLDSQLPSLTNRFLSSQATISQQDRALAAKEMVQNFLKKVITKERLSDLNDLIRSDSITNRTLYFFRSLNDIIKSKNSASVKTNDTKRLWANSSWYDLLSSYRLDLLYVLYWALTSDPKLYKLYVYVRDRTVSTTDPNENALALFPGSLVDSGSGESPLEQIYDDLKEHIESVDGFLGRLFRPGALDYLLCYYRGRAI